ncbi:MAG TPA: aconitate hydratase, partial [Treponema sp.]|nr:aconitate hydratase [Treponema sp.]
MALTLAEKIIQKHIIPGTLDFTPGKPIERGIDIAIKIDQTLTQDATGTMAYLQFETIGIPRVKTEVSVSYIDHNTLQTDFKNQDDHRYLQSIAAKYGLYFSRPGNGVCHQVHIEHFGKPGKTLLGSDSHTPTGGGIGMI